MSEAKERWRQIEEIYHAAVGLAESQRPAFIREACGSDEYLKAEVESLLEHSGSATILDDDALDVGARLMSAGAGSLAGSDLGPYHLVSLIGAGGMGEVYLAEDTRLNREVALKVLPRSFSDDPARKHRFAREARAASALNHPNIVVVHDVGEADGSDFIVMEHVRGDTLAKRLECGPLPFAMAARYGVQIACALAAAHAAGVIHRDLKPGNVMITPDGVAKVLDFGLAKVALQSAGADASSCISSAATIVGTVAYMSPEQARGHTVDARSDIFTFGAVLYEMVAGARAFAGDSTVSTLAAVLTEDPKPIRSIVKSVPPGLDNLLTKCLAKDPAERWQSMAEVQCSLEALMTGKAGGSTAKRWGIRAAIGALVVASIAGAWRLSEPWRVKFGSNHALQLTDYPGEELYPTLSPDGLHVAFTWSRDGEADIFVQPVESHADPVRLTTERARQAYSRWSPDGRSIAYTVGDGVRYTLKVMPAGGGPARELATVGFRTVDWTADSKELLATDLPGAGGHSRIVKISAETGEMRSIPYEADKWTSMTDAYASLSPDGSRIAFSRTSSTGSMVADVYVMSVDGGVPRRLTSRQRYISGLTWTRDGGEILFQSFDQDQKTLCRVRADAADTAVVRKVEGAGELGHYPVFAGRGWTGPSRLLYSRVAGRSVQVVRIDFARDGAAPGNPRVLVPPTASPAGPLDVAISPDGREFAFSLGTGIGRDLFIAPCHGGGARQATRSSAPSLGFPSWSPDGRRIAFATVLQPETAGRGSHTYSLFSVSSQGGPPEMIVREPASLPSFSPDGKWIFFRSNFLDNESFFRVPATGGPHEPRKWQRVTAGGGLPGYGTPATDGEVFVYTRTDRAGIFMIPVQGGHERILLSRSVPHALWAVGPYVYYLDCKPETLLSSVAKPLRRIHLRTGLDQSVSTIPLRLRADGATSNIDAKRLSIAPDGSFAVLVNAVQAADLMLVDRFR